MSAMSIKKLITLNPEQGSHFGKADQPKTTYKDYGTEIWSRVVRLRLNVSGYLQPPSSGYFYPEDGGSMLRRNVSLLISD